MATTTKSKQGNANYKLLKSAYVSAQNSLDKTEIEIGELIRESVNVLTTNKLNQLAGLMRAWDICNERVERTWERFDDFCTSFDYEHNI